MDSYGKSIKASTLLTNKLCMQLTKIPKPNLFSFFFFSPVGENVSSCEYSQYIWLRVWSHSPRHCQKE